LIVDQTSEDAIAAGIKKLLTDQATYARLCVEARARKFRSWSDYTEKLLKHLQLLFNLAARSREVSSADSHGAIQGSSARALIGATRPEREI
jgi:hypothetical protein